MVRTCIPWSAILLPAAFFLSVLRPDATAPNGLIYLATWEQSFWQWA